MENQEKCRDLPFFYEACNILDLEILYPVNSYGGYGPKKEVIYTQHPYGSPVMLADKTDSTSVLYLSNGSIDFRIKPEEFPEIIILNGHFDKLDKRETGVPAQNIWIDIKGAISSLMNPTLGYSLKTTRIKIVKINDPSPAMWYCANYETTTGIKFESAVKVWLEDTSDGPVLLREVLLFNNGDRAFQGKLWPYFDLPSTMEKAWDRDIWYNRGLPLSGKETVIASTVPHRDLVQIKRVMSDYTGEITFAEATCDYLSFIGHSGASALMPLAIYEGQLLNRGAGSSLNRFSTPTIAANCYHIHLKSQSWIVLRQGLQYITNEKCINDFKKVSITKSVGYRAIESVYKNAAIQLIDQTNVDLLSKIQPQSIFTRDNTCSEFQLKLPYNFELEAFFTSIWKNAQGMYGRSYGRRIGDGVEIGMRDKAQDMWPKIKDDPSIVRQDLIHMFSMMYTYENFPEQIPDPIPFAIKLHGMFPRQYPSKWLDRTKPVDSDNRFYADSAIWPIETLLKYIAETGDYTILFEKTKTSVLTDFDNPIKAKLIGTFEKMALFEIVHTIFQSFARQIEDSPYGMPYVMYGDWADPIDMLGSGYPGDISTRGKGRGTSVRLSAHLFLVLIQYIDFLQDTRSTVLFADHFSLQTQINELSSQANQLRKNILKWTWEDCDQQDSTGFISFIHEFSLDGKVPEYSQGKMGYTIGSMLGHDFDGIKRRELLSNAYGLEMINIERDYLDPVPEKKKKIIQIFKMVDTCLADEKIGVKLLSQPIPNNQSALRCCGRMGMLPSGCSENGEYHHAGHMMQYFRLNYPNQVDLAWKYYKPLLSIYHDEYINGPFDMFANSFTADPEDPHYGTGMIFGFSGSLNWAIEIIQRVVGLHINFYNSDQPDICIKPLVPTEFKQEIEFKRTLHYFNDDKFLKIPIHIKIQKCQNNTTSGIWINGEKRDIPKIENVKEMEEIEILMITSLNESIVS